MSLAYPVEAIPTAARCEACGGDGHDWQPVDGQYEPVAECPACHGTGLRPGVRLVAGAR